MSGLPPGLLALLFVSALAQAHPQFAAVIENRIAAYREIGTAHKRITDELRGKKPDLVHIVEAAQLIAEKGVAMPTWFPPGSAPTPHEFSWWERFTRWVASDDSEELPSAVASGARPEIWSRPDEFRRAFQAFDAQAKALRSAAQSGQLAAIAETHRKLSATCKNCHDTFRIDRE